MCVYIHVYEANMYTQSTIYTYVQWQFNTLVLWSFMMQKLWTWIHLWRIVYALCIKLLLDKMHKQLLKQGRQRSAPAQLPQARWRVPTVARGLQPACLGFLWNTGTSEPVASQPHGILHRSPTSCMMTFVITITSITLKKQWISLHVRLDPHQ